ncbi:MAG: hypothetical protein ACOH2H_16105 [Cypionkella sp.]
MSAPQRAQVTGLTPFALCALTVRVLEAEGTVQLVYVSDDFPGGPKALSNQFATPQTSDQLRAIAAKLDAIFAGGQQDTGGAA